MKNLIIATAALLLMLSMMTGWFQLNSLFRTKAQLSAAAEDAACAAALCLDETAFGEGELQFDRAEAEQAAARILSANFPKAEEDGKWEIIFEDAGTAPAVTVRVWYRRLKAVSIYEYLPLRKE